jgi:hypothetical protein
MNKHLNCREQKSDISNNSNFSFDIAGYHMKFGGIRETPKWQNEHPNCRNTNGKVTTWIRIPKRTINSHSNQIPMAWGAHDQTWTGLSIRVAPQRTYHAHRNCKEKKIWLHTAFVKHCDQPYPQKRGSSSTSREISSTNLM